MLPTPRLVLSGYIRCHLTLTVIDRGSSPIHDKVRRAIRLLELDTTMGGRAAEYYK